VNSVEQQKSGGEPSGRPGFLYLPGTSDQGGEIVRLEPRYVLRPVALARRIRSAIIAVGAFGSTAILIASYQAANGSLREHWIYPAGVAAIGVICAVLALMEKAWPEPVARVEEVREKQEAASNGKDHTFPTQP
jgi:hypothetical protein